MGKMQNNSKLRILHLPDLVGGNPTSLSAGERELGHHSQTLSYVDSPFGYGSDIRLKFASRSAPLRWAERIAMFAKIRNQFDVYHFNFGASLLQTANGKFILPELGLYKKSAKKCMTFQGSEIRSKYLKTLELSANMERQLGNQKAVSQFFQLDAFRKSIRARVVERTLDQCNKIYALNPDLLENFPKGSASFYPYAITPPKLIELEAIKSKPRNFDKPLHILHATTSRLLKGTGLIEQALEKARQEFGITFEILERVPRDVFLQKLENADIFIDQMVLGWYGATSVEAMYLGTPVLTYFSEEQLSLKPANFEPQKAIVNVHADQLYEKIREMNSNKEMLLHQSLLGYKFVYKNHLPKHVARQVVDGYFEE